MGMKEIEIIIDKNGEVRVHVMGIKGASCLEFTKWLEQALGPTIQQQFTGEYYEPEALNPLAAVQQRSK
jgi:acylphosphatase